MTEFEEPFEKKAIPSNGGVISLVGAGGKTTLMFSLAKWMAACGMKVVSTTTTKIFMPESSETCAVVLEDLDARLISRAEKLLSRYRHITVGAGCLADQNKMKGLSTESVAALRRSGIADWIIVEADGAARRQLKAPAPHEPVIPADTTCVVAVAGLVAIGKPLGDLNVFRADRFAALTGLSPGEPVTASSVVSVLLHDNGMMKGAPAGACKIVFLNEAGQVELRRAGMEVAALLRQMGGDKLQGVLIGYCREESCKLGLVEFDMSEVAGIVLAAGSSSRMNGLLKAMLPINGKPMLRCVVESALKSSLDRVIVVLGNAFETISRVFPITGAEVVFNPEFLTGQSSSLRAGLLALGKSCDGALFILGDQPLVDSSVIDAVVGKFKGTRMPIVVPYHLGKPGNPVFFARSLFPEIMALRGDVGARSLIEKHGESVATVEVANESIHLDVDTWEDYLGLLERINGIMGERS